ncbi:hypothetical protein ACPB8Q_05050 [Methanocaldococcus indicus]|uniref:hypothetical protein n=1 Tax=Methanocaldococcus indicus TaxID=213231 RepID=UPI003C6D3F0B
MQRMKLKKTFEDNLIVEQKLQRLKFWTWTDDPSYSDNWSHYDTPGASGAAYGDYADHSDYSDSQYSDSSSNGTINSKTSAKTSAVTVGKIEYSNDGKVYVKDNNGNIITVTNRQNLSSALQRLASKGIIDKNYSEFYTPAGTRVIIQGGKVSLPAVMDNPKPQDNTSNKNKTINKNSSDLEQYFQVSKPNPSKVSNVAPVVTKSDLPKYATIESILAPPQTPDVAVIQQQYNNKIMTADEAVKKFYNENKDILYYDEGRQEIDNIERKIIEVPTAIGKKYGGIVGGTIGATVGKLAAGGVELIAGTGWAIGTAAAKKSFEPIKTEATIITDGALSPFDSIGKALDYIAGYKKPTEDDIIDVTSDILTLAPIPIIDIKAKFQNLDSLKTKNVINYDDSLKTTKQTPIHISKYMLDEPPTPKPNMVDVIGDKYQLSTNILESGVEKTKVRFGDKVLEAEKSPQVEVIRKTDFSVGRVQEVRKTKDSMYVVDIDLSKLIPEQRIVQISKNGAKQITKGRNYIFTSEINSKGISKYVSGQNGFIRTKSQITDMLFDDSKPYNPPKPHLIDNIEHNHKFFESKKPKHSPIDAPKQDFDIPPIQIIEEEPKSRQKPKLNPGGGRIIFASDLLKKLDEVSGEAKSAGSKTSQQLLQIEKTKTETKSSTKLDVIEKPKQVAKEMENSKNKVKENELEKKIKKQMTEIGIFPLYRVDIFNFPVEKEKARRGIFHYPVVGQKEDIVPTIAKATPTLIKRKTKLGQITPKTKLKQIIPKSRTEIASITEEYHPITRTSIATYPSVKTSIITTPEIKIVAPIPKIPKIKLYGVTGYSSKFLKSKWKKLVTWL